MTLFEASHFLIEKPFYEDGNILLPHLATLAFSLAPAGEVTDTYSYFLVGVFHLLSSAILALGGIYHAIFGPERLEESISAFIFACPWQDRFRITAILGAHLLTLALAVLLLFIKASYLGGLYDTWASGGGDIRLLKTSTINLQLLKSLLAIYLLARYLISHPVS